VQFIIITKNLFSHLDIGFDPLSHMDFFINKQSYF
jgi:hypothetical protein